MTAPYSKEEWNAIVRCGDAVEASLSRSGVQLTMGGEPTFVPLVPEGAEWQTAALGPTKLGLARRFARELVGTAFPGSVALETTGKLYPGEPLPRWAILLQWRAGGPPLWKDSTLLRGDNEVGAHAAADARRMLEALADRLGIDRRLVLVCGDPAAPDIPAGFVLPLDFKDGAWISDDWRRTLRTETATLWPGDSHVGLRLPLDKLKEENLRRALTVEVRKGSINVFLPPLPFEGYGALLATIEQCLVSCGVRDVVLAGYAPPPDPRLPTVGLASDPGVIEVNLAPCATWSDYDRQLGQIYTAAARAGLSARKLQFNGRAAGTGGGAHLVFGGPEAFVSPFFTRPSLLPSIIRYWQRHPSLSYAFSGQYMGPSSQAPRIDESTFEALYELEIACAGAGKFASADYLPQFDMLFRDLLMDRTGNTHRAEISVDKLWNPVSGNGRLGLVEWRAFESHPAAPALSLTGLFIRALLARLAADPFGSPFTRWGGALHDRFFLPAFVREDLASICSDLAENGIPFDAAWLRPLLEWRFPELGRMHVPGAPKPFTLTFRQALEAWPLLGEQPSGAGTSRSVDSSCDRIEASVADAASLAGGTLLVNGLPCAFGSCGDGGAAAGIRFRAFFLIPGLHPHVPVHSPLLIEWVDRETSTVAAAARWHVWNPHNEPYLDRPQNEAAAAQRHAERWETWTATVGQKRGIPALDFPPESRNTLDLRRYPPAGR